MHKNERVQLTQRVIALYIKERERERKRKNACVRTSLEWYFFLPHCVWMCVVVSGYIITHCRCKCTSLDSCFPLSFSLNVSLHIRLYCYWFYEYTYVSWFLFLCLWMSVSFSLNIRISLRLYWLLGRVYVSWSLFLDFSFFVSECLYHCQAVLWPIVCAYTLVILILSEYPY